jgi:hypothetical protein
VSFYSPTKPLPTLSEVWGLNAAPLNQTREKTRNDLRGVLDVPASGDGLAMLTAYMNGIADIAPDAVAEVEALLAEWKTCDAARAAAEVAAPWDDGAPLKRADVLEYDTSLLASGGWAASRTAGLSARMEAIQARLRATLGLPRSAAGSGVVPMIRS